MNDFLKDPYPPRCRTKEDAVEVLDSIKEGLPVQDLLVLYWMEGYEDCQFELEIRST